MSYSIRAQFPGGTLVEKGCHDWRYVSGRWIQQWDHIPGRKQLRKPLKSPRNTGRVGSRGLREAAPHPPRLLLFPVILSLPPSLPPTFSCTWQLSAEAELSSSSANNTGRSSRFTEWKPQSPPLLWGAQEWQTGTRELRTQNPSTEICLANSHYPSW